jgi:predicted DNA binding protein
MIAEFRAIDPEFPLAETLASMANLDVRTIFQPGTDVENGVRHFSVSCSDYDAFDGHLERDESVTDYSILRRRAGRRRYRIRFDCEVHYVAGTVVGKGLLIERLRSANDEWEFRVFAPDRETLLEAIECCKSRCRSFTLTELHTADDAGGGEGIGLTSAQRETLCLAQREGFFEVPRNISQAELAEQLGVSTSAVSQRLRKGLAVVLGEALGPD